MRFHLPFTAILATIASATPLVNSFAKRDGAAVVAAVDAVSASMTELNTTVTSYNGGLLGTLTALKIEFQSIALTNTLKDAISTANASANFTNAESINVSGAFLELEPAIFSTLDNIISKKKKFDKGLLGIGSLSFLVKSNLQTLKDLSNQFGEVVVPKLTKAFQAIAPQIIKDISDKFDEALAVYA